VAARCDAETRSRRVLLRLIDLFSSSNWLSLQPQLTRDTFPPQFFVFFIFSVGKRRWIIFDICNYDFQCFPCFDFDGCFDVIPRSR
jgi:hypothetical protein